MYLLPELPYAYDALEPYIDKEIMKLHHDIHHQVYVDKLNKALKDYPKYIKYNPEILVANWKKLPKAIQESVRNFGGGHINHSLLWSLMAKNKDEKPAGNIISQINTDFVSLDKFKNKFNEAGVNLFGSGWVWLIYTNKRLKITTSLNQDSPLTNGDWPIIGQDVWEHAYYLQYYNKRNEYLDSWWNVVNWSMVEKRFNIAKNLSERKSIKSELKKQYGL
jgi:superoxide dismutase, Fe-Mn family